ncbi:MAG TPA: GIY-YIG nuclease family protein [Candidatus Paceibacterota bacterium]
MKLPNTPGVYFWRNAAGTILYIGKATSLRDRTRSYFSPDLIKTRGPRLVDMVFKSTHVTWQETDSVLEALILEANLIKKYQPHYNRDEKDDKSFNCIAITKEVYPRILLVRQKDIDARNKLITLPKQKGIQIPYDAVFGPYPRGSSLKDALAIIRHIFPFRDRASAMKDKETFYRQIGLAPDVTSVEATKQYKKNIGRIKLILQGKLKHLVEALKKEMLIKARAEKFEEANELKQKIFALEHIQDVSLIKRDLVTGGGANVFRIEAYDVAHISGKQMVGVMTVVENATSNKNDYRKFIIRGYDTANDAGALREILTRRLAHPEWTYPNAIVVDGNIIQMNAARTVLASLGLDIPVIAVTKDERHRPKSLSGPEDLIELHKYAILLANSESHRFALSFHKDRRSKAML